MDLQLQPHPAIENDSELGRPTKFALFLAEKAGATGLFYLLVFWYGGWITLAMLKIGPFKHDTYPFPLLLFLSNAIQLIYLPLLQIKSKYDAKVNDRANTHIANVLDQIADHLGVEGAKALDEVATARIHKAAKDAGDQMKAFEKEAKQLIVC